MFTCKKTRLNKKEKKSLAFSWTVINEELLPKYIPEIKRGKYQELYLHVNSESGYIPNPSTRLGTGGFTLGRGVVLIINWYIAIYITIFHPSSSGKCLMYDVCPLYCLV